MATQIKLRRDSYQNWYDNNPILGQGEPGYDLTNQKLKIGDGVTLWRVLPYFNDQEDGSSDRLINGLNEVVLEADGTIVLPSQIVASASGYEMTDPTLAIGTLGSNTIITQPAYNSINRGNQNIHIQGQRGYGTLSTTGAGGWGGNIEIQGGLGGQTNDVTEWSGGEGGYVGIRGGDGQMGSGGGFVQIRGGDAVESVGSTNTVDGGNVLITAGDAVSNIETGKGTGGYVYINAGAGNNTNGQVVITTSSSSNQWRFRQDGVLSSAGGSWTKTTNSSISTGIASQVVWTSTVSDISGAKLTIQVECDETGGIGSWETQVCEAIIAVRGYTTTSQPVISVYGVTHTSVAPLMTFAVQRNPVTGLIEIVGTRTATARLDNGASLRIYSVETGTND